MKKNQNKMGNEESDWIFYQLDLLYSTRTYSLFRELFFSMFDYIKYYVIVANNIWSLFM
jgi:hypothetical protein